MELVFERLGPKVGSNEEVLKMFIFSFIENFNKDLIGKEDFVRNLRRVF